MLVPDRAGGLQGLGMPGVGGRVSGTSRPAGKPSASVLWQVDRSVIGSPFDGHHHLLQKHTHSAQQLRRIMFSFCYYYYKNVMVNLRTVYLESSSC